MKIKEKRLLNYKGKVYDLETEDCAYNVEKLIVHNSASSSLILYLLGITDINPMKYKMMLFERFMSPGRRDVPDVDSDLAPSIRKQVIEYAISTFGRNNVFPVGTQGTIKLRMAIHDVFKALGEDFEKVVKYTKQVPADAELEAAPIDEVIEKIPVLKELFDKHERSREFVDELRNKVRSFGQHAGGVVVSGVDITKTLPLVKTSTDTFVTSNTEGGDNREITNLGFIKYDLLSLTTLDLINDTSKLIKDRHGIDIDWNEIHEIENDLKDMYKLLSNGDCYGIFQFGSRLAKAYLKEMKPESLNDLCVASALLRPGPLDQEAHTTYANRKNGLEKIDIHDCLKPFLSDTLGILVFQEQVLRITQELCGFSKEEANKFRKDLVKYEKALDYERMRLTRIASNKERIVDSFISNGMNEEEANKWWDYIEAFSRYAFNFSHSLSYSYHSYRQLWQKYFYTIEFYCSAFNNESLESYSSIVSNVQKFTARKLVDEKLVEYKISILQPDLRRMNAKFTIEGDSIRHGLCCIKFITEASFEVFNRNLKEEDLNDFEKFIVTKYEKNGKNKFVIDKKLASALIYSGALDYLSIDRSELALSYNKIRKSNIDSVIDTKELSSLEKHYLGYSLLKQNSALKIKEKLEAMKNYLSLSELSEDKESNKLCIDYVLVKNIYEKISKRKSKYRILTVETSDGDIGPIFVWDEDIKLKKDEYYLAKFQKDDTFIKLIEASG